MIETAENLRRQYGITRAAQDEYAVASHRKAAAAQAEGRFAQELLPVTVAGRTGDRVVDVDEHIRPDANLDALARLSPILVASDPEATVTAGNASGQNDAAAACIVTTESEAGRRGLTPLLRLRSWAVSGCAPETMGLGPVPASAAALDRAGLTLADLDVIELNEAFAAQVLAVLREWRIDPGDERLNPNGSGISLGHPVGATGARILATLAYDLRRRGGGLALATMCIGGGQGLAAVVEGVA
jgi:acetyl-CoA C-acetyltransferase